MEKLLNDLLQLCKDNDNPLVIVDDEFGEMEYILIHHEIPNNHEFVIVVSDFYIKMSDSVVETINTTDIKNALIGVGYTEVTKLVGV